MVIDGGLARTRLPQIASLIPILGYAVLWGDAFQEVVMRFELALGSSMLLDPITRIRLLYFGSTLMLFGLIIYWWRCPRPIQQFATRREYIQYVNEGGEQGEARSAAAAIKRAGPWNEEQKRFLPHKATQILGFEVTSGDVFHASEGSTLPAVFPVLQAHYELLDRSRPISSALAAAFTYVGTAVFLVPSVEVFVTSVWRLVFPT